MSVGLQLTALVLGQVWWVVLWNVLQCRHIESRVMDVALVLNFAASQSSSYVVRFTRYSAQVPPEALQALDCCLDIR